MVMSDLEVDVLDELGSGCLKFLFGPPRLVPEISAPQMATGVLFRLCWLGRFAALFNLSQQCTVALQWIPSHCEIEGNEEAD